MPMPFDFRFCVIYNISVIIIGKLCERIIRFEKNNLPVSYHIARCCGCAVKCFCGAGSDCFTAAYRIRFSLPHAEHISFTFADAVHTLADAAIYISFPIGVCKADRAEGDGKH